MAAKEPVLSRSDLRKIARILDAEIMPLLSAQLRERMPPTEDFVMFREVGQRCIEERTKQGLTLKSVAARLKVPQYRLKAIEENSLRNIQLPTLRLYLEFLGLRDWYLNWSRTNRALAKRYGFVLPTRT
jgi:hypothetical protein